MAHDFADRHRGEAARDWAVDLSATQERARHLGSGITNKNRLFSFLNSARPLLQAIIDYRRLKVGWG